MRRLTEWFNGKLDREVTREILTEKVYQRLHPTNPAAPGRGNPARGALRTCAIIFPTLAI